MKNLIYNWGFPHCRPNTMTGGPPEALGILTARYSTAVKGLVITGVLQARVPGIFYHRIREFDLEVGV